MGENLYGLAALIAWNPWVPFSLIMACAVLRRGQFHLPGYLCAVMVGGAVGLSHSDALRQVAPPPDCAALDPFLTALWIGLLTFAAEWPPAQAAADPADSAPEPPPHRLRPSRLTPWLFALRETLLTVILFLTAAWRPDATGVLCGLLGLYGLSVLGLWIYAAARRYRVVRRLQAAAASGAVRAQIQLQPDPLLRAAAVARRKRYAFFALLVALLLAAAGWLNIVPGSNWIDAQIGRGMQNVLLRTNAVPPRGEDAIGYQLAIEADCLQHIAPLPYLWWRLHCATAMAEFGVDPYPTRRGYFLHTYISPVDDSPQVYTVWVPDNYDPDTPLPLLVWLHGHVGFRAYHGLWIPTDLWTDKAIVIAPQARGSLDYTGIQMNEVARAIHDVKQRYTIDRSRVYLAGHSMGGTGSWYLASRWPFDFAAIAPSAPNLSPWAWGYEAPTGDPIRDDLAIRLQQNEAAIGHAANLGNMPFLASHSDDDRLVPVENTRLMVAAIEALHAGQPAPVPQLYLESQNQGIGHGMSISPARRLNWLLQFRRPPPTEQDLRQAMASPPPVPAYGPIYRAFDEPFVLIVPDSLRPWADIQPTDNRELALQQIAREVIAFQKFWSDRYHCRPRVMSVSAYLRCRDPRRETWHPIFLGGPDVNLATAMLIERDGPFAAWQLPEGFDAREEHLTAAGDTARGPAILYAIAPPTKSNYPSVYTPPPFAVVISANDGSAYFQALRRYGIQFGSYALRNRIWFDYALSDALSFDNTRLIRTYGFYTAAGEADLTDSRRAYRGASRERIAELGVMWPTPADRLQPFPADPLDTATPTRARFHYPLYQHLPSRVDSDTPLSFNAHAKGEPLRLNGDPAHRGAGGKICLKGISLGAVGAVAGHASADWQIPPGRWKLTGRVGPDFAVYPPLRFDALDALRLPGRTARRPVAGYRVFVDGKQVWMSAQPLPGGNRRGRNRTAPEADDPPAWKQLEYPLDLPLPPGKVITLETFTLRGNPWELPPTVWADVQLERIDDGPLPR